MKRRLLRGAGWMLLAALLSSCLTLEEQVLPEHVKTLGIPMWRNKTLEYGVEERLTDVVVQEFLRDGRLRVVRPSDADALLLGEIIGYEIKGRQYDDEDHAIGFLVDVAVEVELLDARSGRPLVEKRRFNQAGIFFDSPQPRQTRQDDVFIRLCEEIKSTVLEGW
ncbi:hypothetical protein HS125_12545 [bacterium]|nr:hypothetical protein [bacterium]